MRLKEISIMRYGPLVNTGRIPLHSFNLFFGRNEVGKTLTIDAIVKLLLGSNLKGFDRIDRVDESPEGFIIVEDERGQEIKLPEKGNLAQVVDLSPRECRNIFIIRNSDLSVESEGSFYTEVTDRLSGLRTMQISAIKDNLREIAKITPTGVFRDIKEEKLKTRMEKAETLVSKITGLLTETEEEKLGELEEENATCKEEIEKITVRISALEEARKREKYEKGIETLQSLKDALEEQAELTCYKQDDQQLWWSCEKDIASYIEEKRELMDELTESETKYEEINKELSTKEKEFDASQEIKKRLDYEVRSQIEDFENRREELARQENMKAFFIWSAIICASLLGASLIGAIVSPTVLFYIAAAIFLPLTIICGFSVFYFFKNKASLAKAFEEISLTLVPFPINKFNFLIRLRRSY